MYCIHCGKQIDDSATFCCYCGTKLKNDAPPPQYGESSQGQNIYPPNNGYYQNNLQNNSPQYNHYENNAPQYYRPQNNGYVDTSNPIAIVGFVFAFIFALVGLICSIIGYNKAKNENAQHGDLAYAGIIISIVSMVIAFVFWIIIFIVALTEGEWVINVS